ncbi:MAG: sulfatase-like hydrolase/transferase, partial [Bacteroidota bacterium]
EYEQAPMYKTDFITDYALKWMDEAFEKDDPLFLYLPYHAAHYPLQARPEDIEKYRGKYLKGWDKLRAERFERMQSLGVLAANTKMSPPEGNLNTLRGPLIPDYVDYYPWESLSEGKKDTLDLEMAVYAAIIDRMDQNIGRVLEKLKAEGELENTLIMFLVDNGACPFYSNKSDVLPGPADSYWCQRAAWANVGNTPFRQYKQCGHEGGSHTPFIAYWPEKIEPNTITEQPGHVVDVLPTFLDVLETEYPDSIAGFPTISVAGSSLLPIFEGEQREEPLYFISGLDKHRMFRIGDYKIVRLNSGPWELYNIKEDPSELVNLAATNPERLAEVLRDVEAMTPELTQQVSALEK